MHGIETIKKINGLGYVPVTRSTTYPRRNLSVAFTVKQKIYEAYQNNRKNETIYGSIIHTVNTLRTCDVITASEHKTLLEWNDHLYSK